MSYKVSGKDWADIFFKLDPSDVSKSRYMCNLCPVGSQLYTSAKGHGCTNLNTHITGNHSESITDMVNEFRGIKNTNTLDNKVNELMKDLKKLKNASILRSIKDTNGLMPVTRNVTRWSSTWEMLVRFLILVLYLHNCGLPEATKALIPSYVEIHELTQLKDQLQKFQDTTLSLQSDSGEIDLYFVRTLFDNLIRQHPSCVKHLSPTSDIVHKMMMMMMIEKKR